MKSLLSELRAALLATVVLALACCGAYPLVVHAISQALFPDKANGSLIMDSNGVVRGSALLGQSFADPAYFQPRPSAAGAGYDAANSGGSNLGPTSRKLHDQIRERVAAYRLLNGLAEADPVPADAVTTSGSGLDPHISVQNARLQAMRVARIRGVSIDRVEALVASSTETPVFGILGEYSVHVLRLNLALDATWPR